MLLRYEATHPAYLFQCGDTNLFAVSVDRSGINIPTNNCWEGWRFRREFPLSVHTSVPAAIDPELILRGIRAYGYYIWSEGTASKPKGTSQ